MTLLDLSSKKSAGYVYRILPADRFEQGLRSGTNVLVLPRLWKDPFENFIMSAVGILPDGRAATFGFRDHFYGQCWSLHRETELMWRGYSPAEDGVKLRARAKTLHDSLARHLGALAAIGCFLGRVQYLKRDDMNRVLAQGLVLDNTNEAQARTLLLKRFGFRSEKEVRLVAYYDRAAEPPGLFRYPVDWNDLVEEVVIHPAMPHVKSKALKARLASAGYRGRVIQSGLYKRPKRHTIRVRYY